MKRFKNLNTTHGGVGRCAVGVVVFGVGRVARGTRGVVWELRGQVRVANARKNIQTYSKHHAVAAFFAYFLWLLTKSRTP